ncbi:uncharacterized protein LOC126050071 isoform X2 [Accipiter gentilis]|nr:uncharacterized protein LOC126050071 isoform X2 [Accipiter gentilis]XP_049683420.1 uncharacterized protein LOC126050071 isoform X2 [Accipiter gentilis]XP_049683421.1 uncharacterized protein LOC126050071 isoform X2 [Accipiter gentilis]
MSSLQGCCTLCSILMLVGGNLAILVKIHENSINGTEGQSVLLRVSYRFHSDPQYPMKIVWNSGNMQDNLVTCSVLKCSLGARGVPGICSAQIFYHPTYRNRIKLFPENGTLLLSDLQPSDSRVYSVTFQASHQTFHINLTVHEQCSTPEHPHECTELGGGATATRIPCYIFGGCCCFILLFLQLFFHLRWHRVRAQLSGQTPGRRQTRRPAQPQGPRAGRAGCSTEQLRSRSDAAS